VRHLLIPQSSLFLGDDAAITARKLIQQQRMMFTAMYVAGSGQATFTSDTDFTIVVSSITE
jgi:hypothetical protein